MVLAASMLWAVYTVGSKPLLARHSPLKLTAWPCSPARRPARGVSLPDLATAELGRRSAAAVARAVVLGLAVGCRGIPHLGHRRPAGGQRSHRHLLQLTPVVAILVAWVVLGDRLTLLQWLGAAVVIGGLLLTRRGRTPDGLRPKSAIIQPHVIGERGRT